MQKLKLIICLYLVITGASAQTKDITLEDIWVKNTFASKSVEAFRWMKNSNFYTALKNGKIEKTSILNTEIKEILFDGQKYNLNIHSYEFNADETKLLIASNFEAKYRRSGKAEYYVFDLKSQQLKYLSVNGKISEISLSPNGDKLAFVRENNLYFYDLTADLETQITTNGQLNSIINGATDWVYEEEFAFTKAFFWSTDGNKIAFYTFDESLVKEYNLQIWGGLYPKTATFKYPKAGENNAIVSISIYDLAQKITMKVDIGNEKDQYIPQIQWTNDSNILAIWQLNRKQNNFNLLHFNLSENKTKTIIAEKSDKYIDVKYNYQLVYLSDNQTFITTSEQSGFKHIYQYNLEGKLVKQITNGQWEVIEIKGIDQKTKEIYYTSTEQSPLEKHLYRINYEAITTNTKAKKTTKGKEFIAKSQKLTIKPGINNIDLSADFQYFVEANSSISKPAETNLIATKNLTTLKNLENNELLKNKIVEFGIKPLELFSMKISTGDSLNGYMIKPNNFDQNKKYPILMFVYGGPGSQRVANEWAKQDFYWYKMLAQKGYIIACVDNRGTGFRGRDFRQITYGNLGKIEVNDQVQVAQYFGNLPFVDKSRIGIWGWSYGGFMAANCIFQASETFKAAIAVAPVANWNYYDTIYTERYNGLPSENPNGYSENSPITHAAKLNGNFLLIHGTGDDNVHFQNSVALQDVLIAKNKQFTSFFYPNRNHGISGGNTRLHLYKLMTDWLEKNL